MSYAKHAARKLGERRPCRDRRAPGGRSLAPLRKPMPSPPRH